jgi:hypothetical protein
MKLNIFEKIKLKIWYIFLLKKNEFSPKLDLFYIKNKFKKYNLKEEEFNLIVYQRRDIAHLIDLGELNNISKEKLKQSRI